MSLRQSIQVSMATMEILTTTYTYYHQQKGEGAKACYRHDWHSRQSAQLASKTCKPYKTLYEIPQSMVVL